MQNKYIYDKYLIGADQLNQNALILKIVLEFGIKTKTNSHLMSSPKYAFKPMIGSILRASDKLIEKLIISGKPIKRQI